MLYFVLDSSLELDYEKLTTFAVAMRKCSRDRLLIHLLIDTWRRQFYASGLVSSSRLKDKGR